MFVDLRRKGGRNGRGRRVEGGRKILTETVLFALFFLMKEKVAAFEKEEAAAHTSGIRGRCALLFRAAAVVIDFLLPEEPMKGGDSAEGRDGNAAAVIHFT